MNRMHAYAIPNQRFLYLLMPKRKTGKIYLGSSRKESTKTHVLVFHIYYMPNIHNYYATDLVPTILEKFPIESGESSTQYGRKNLLRFTRKLINLEPAEFI